MAHATLTPVFVGLRVGLHVLLVGLAAFAVVPGFVTERSSAPWALLIAILFVAVYAGGVLLPRKRVPATLWVAALTLLWAVLVWLAPEGAYLVFPLFFLYLHVLPGAGGIIAVIASTAIAILALGLHLGFSVGGVIGPLVGAGAAILIGLGYRALAREAAERQELVDELLRTRERLAATEREQGALAERARLAREIDREQHHRPGVRERLGAAAAARTAHGQDGRGRRLGTRRPRRGPAAHPRRAHRGRLRAR